MHRRRFRAIEHRFGHRAGRDRWARGRAVPRTRCRSGLARRVRDRRQRHPAPSVARPGDAQEPDQSLRVPELPAGQEPVGRLSEPRGPIPAAQRVLTLRGVGGSPVRPRRALRLERASDRVRFGERPARGSHRVRRRGRLPRSLAGLRAGAVDPRPGAVRRSDRASDRACEPLPHERCALGPRGRRQLGGRDWHEPERSGDPARPAHLLEGCCGDVDLPIVRDQAERLEPVHRTGLRPGVRRSVLPQLGGDPASVAPGALAKQLRCGGP